MICAEAGDSKGASAGIVLLCFHMLFHLTSFFFVLINPPLPFNNLSQSAWFPDWGVAAVDIYEI